MIGVKMVRSKGLVAFALGGVAGILWAQPAPQPSERFEVVSIRPSGSNPVRPSIEFTPGGGLRATNVTLQMLIQIAYDIRPEQLSGGPGWTDSELYTVVAKAPAGGPVLPEAAQHELVRKRLQTSLAEHFHLALKREGRPASGYALTVETKGHAMTVSHQPGAVRLRQVGRWEVRAEAVEMSTFAKFLSVHLQATVEDRTGLEGGFSFHLKWNPELREGQSVRAFDGLPEDSLVPAVREQLGLRLEGTESSDRSIHDRARGKAERKLKNRIRPRMDTDLHG
jgi:bla regulator protein blaR1